MSKGSRRAPAAEPVPPGEFLKSFLAGGGRPEPWAWLAFALGIGLVAGWALLLVRPGGSFPPWFYSAGRFHLVLVALVLMIVGVGWSLLRRPFRQRMRGTAFVVLLLVIGAAPFPVPYPSSREFRPSAVELRLPVEGRWRTVWGGGKSDRSPLALLADRRWGLILVREDEGGERLREGADPSRPDGWLGHGDPVLAPAAGRVVFAADGGLWAAEHPLGAHVALEIAEGEYAVFSNLSDVEVSLDQEVEKGEILGRIGASGTAPVIPQPHLAAWLTTDPEPGRGEGIPWAFRGLEVDGHRLLRPHSPVGKVEWNGTLAGQIVRQLDD